MNKLTASHIPNWVTGDRAPNEDSSSGLIAIMVMTFITSPTFLEPCYPLTPYLQQFEHRLKGKLFDLLARPVKTSWGAGDGAIR